MDTEHLDLLPEARRRTLRRAYLLRLSSVVMTIVLILTVVASVLLIPTYTYLLSAERSESAQLASIEGTLSTGQESTLGKRLSLLEASAARINTLATAPTASALMKKLLAVSRPSIILAGFSYSAPTKAKKGTLIVSGTAGTRNDLRSFQLGLLAVPGFANADLPVSSYAKDHDIPFSITITLASTTPP